ncbi:hypothetical protein FOA52_010818 [Chlamydomonas sp. UWO 241]|nr:hypothetical protein FOA52_010818 [Chlamydomonas sp. UWO 241]
MHVAASPYGRGLRCAVALAVAALLSMVVSASRAKLSGALPSTFHHASGATLRHLRANAARAGSSASRSLRAAVLPVKQDDAPGSSWWRRSLNQDITSGDACVLTVTMPVASLAHCGQLAESMGNHPFYTAGITMLPTVTGCTECLIDTVEDSGHCIGQIRLSFSTRADLLQFYANAGARPVNIATGQAVTLPPQDSGSPLPTDPVRDVWHIETLPGATGGACGSPATYADSCGSAGRLEDDVAVPCEGDVPIGQGLDLTLPSAPTYPLALLDCNVATPTVTITSPTSSLELCRDMMKQFSKSDSYVAELDQAPLVRGCNACVAGSSPETDKCVVQIFVTFGSTHDMLQWYANGGARPMNINGALILLPPQSPNNPLPESASSYDAFQRVTLYAGLGRGCGSVISYADSCGAASQPANSIPVPCPDVPPSGDSPSTSIGSGAVFSGECHTPMLLLTAPTTSLALCEELRGHMSWHPKYITGLSAEPSVWGCSGCLHGTSTENGTCVVQIAASFATSDDLLMFYANAGARPADDFQTLLTLPDRLADVLPADKGEDLWQIETVYQALGRGCGSAIVYADSCGMAAQTVYSAEIQCEPEATGAGGGGVTLPGGCDASGDTPLLVIEGPAASLLACDMLVDSIKTDEAYTAGLSSPPTVSDQSCAACLHGTAATLGGCVIQVNVTFASRGDLLQFYANAGARPEGADGQLEALPVQKPEGNPHPTSSGGDADVDEWQLSTLYAALGRGCGHPISYMDSCGWQSQAAGNAASFPCGVPAAGDSKRRALMASAAKAGRGLQGEQLGPIYRIRLATNVVAIVTDPAEAARICMRGDAMMDKALIAYNGLNLAAKGPITVSLLTSHTDDQWKLLRKAVSPCFSSANVKAALPIIQSISVKIMDQIEAAGPTQAHDIVDLARRVTVEVIGRWGFKMSFGGDDLSKPNKIVSMMDGILNAVHRLWNDPFWAFKLLTSKEARMHRASTLVYDNFMDDIMRELQARPLVELPSDCIAGAVMRTTQPFGKPLPPQQLKANISVMLAAGFETSASAIGHIVLSLLQHPAELVRLEEELDSLGLLKTPKRREPRAVEWEDLGRMTFLNAVIKETLRVHSPAGMGTIRMASKATKICGYDVPAGTWICLPGAALDRSTAVYGEDANTFRPDRWISRSPSDTDNGGAGIAWAGTGAYDGDDAGSVADQAAHAQGRIKEPIAFSMGPRDCVGQALARLEMQVIIAELFSRFHVSLAPGMGTPDEIFARQVFHVTLSFDGEVLVRMEPR